LLIFVFNFFSVGSSCFHEWFYAAGGFLPFLFIFLPVFFAETAYLLARSPPQKVLDQDFCSVSVLCFAWGVFLLFGEGATVGT